MWVRRSLYLMAAVFLVLPAVTFAMAYLIVDVPKPGDIRTNQVSTILASDGSELAKIVPPEGNRVDVNIDQIPVHVRDAVMAAEDRDFYSNPGFSFTGFARAVKNNIFGGDTQGGSTITQQYVKNALVGSERAGVGGLVRKAKELVISTKMSSEWSKDASAAVVPEHHLLRPRRLRHPGGVARRTSTSPSSSSRSPRVRCWPRWSSDRRRWTPRSTPRVRPTGGTGCSTAWSSIGALAPGDRAAQVFPPTVPPDQARSQNQTTGPNGLIERQVTKELLELFDRSEQTLNTEGLQVTTTIDPKAQATPPRKRRRRPRRPGPDMRTAVVSIDPRTGGVKAYYGGTDANGFDFAQAGLQTGSSFKVFALIAALQQGMGLGLPGGQLTGDGRRDHHHQRRGQQLWHLQHRRGAQAVAEHRLLPADAETRTTGPRTSPPPRTRPVSPRASPASSTPCPRTVRAARRTTESCWASTRLA